jgi:hypothetical protein
MSAALLVVAAVVGTIAVLIARTLAISEVKAQIQRRLRQQLEALIASLPDELQAEWGDEWRTELDIIISMPGTSMVFLRSLRRWCRELSGEKAHAGPHHDVLTAIFSDAPARATRAEHRIRFAGRLLPLEVRDRQIREWVDNLVCEHEASGDPQRVLRSILLRSVLPIAIGARMRVLGRVFARPR